MHVEVEVCVSSVEEAMVAADCGVDTVEICTWPDCGGVTPSSGLVDAIRSAVQVPVRILIRPTPDGFRYSTMESMVLLTDAEVFGGGALDLVTGALDGQGLHPGLMREVGLRAPESRITFHRAIDQVDDPLQVLDQCLALGLDRILTSGGAVRAMDGVPVLARLVQRAAEQCTIAAAGGIDPTSVVGIVERTGVQEVHFAARRPATAMENRTALSSAVTPSHFPTVPDRAKIEGVLEALAKAGLR